MFGRPISRITKRTWRSGTALIATTVVAASVLSTGPAAAVAVLTADIVVHAGGTRSSVTTVSGLSGATFTAVPVVAGGAGFTCVTGAAGTCTITVPTGLTSGTRLAYVVSETAPPASWYLNPNLDYGNSNAGSPTPYAFKTGPLVSASTVNVPGATGEGSYSDASSPGNPFTGLLATSLNNPQAPTACGLKIALILDQSGSMTSGTKQADLKAAAKKVITTLTGTPSQMAIYTFGASTGGSIALTTLGSTAQAAPLTNFINGLPTPSGGTNWDRGLAQAVTATKQYDLVVVLTDGNPTTDHTGSGGNNTTNFHNVENGIYSANAIKNLGSRLVAIGIGVNGGQDNLRAISGPSLNSDYYLGTSGDFDDVFKALATGNCSGILTVQKQIQDFQGNVITNSPAANGWDFAGTVSSPAAALTFPATATVNGATGFTQTAVSIPAGSTPTVTITETLTGGYTFVGAVCSVGGTTVPTTAAGTATSPGVSFAAAANVPLACTFTNKQPPPTSSLTVQKLDATTNAPVAGATFQLYREATAGTRNPGSDTAVGSACTTAGSPAQCVSAATLTFGTYYWVETAAPTGYVLPAAGAARYSAAYTIDAAHTGTPVANVTVSDAQVTSSLSITKLDAVTNVALPGATFQLYREAVTGTQSPATDTAVGSPCTTAGVPAKCVSAATLTFGTYYWVETVAPTGYLLPAAGAARNSAPYTIDATHTGTPVATLSVTDTQLTSSLAIKKLDATTNLAVAGAKFQLYRETVVGTPSPGTDVPMGAPCTTSGSPAQCESLPVLPFGTYYWVETVAPTGYVLPTGTAAISAAYTLDATHTGAPAATLSVIDAQKLSSLAVRKLDATTDATLAGATFQLYREATAGTRNPALDSALGSCTTVGSPAACASSATLNFGTYYWVETAAPVGYVLPAGSAAYSAAYTIDAAHTGTPVATLSVSDAQITSSLAIKKLDAATSLPVAGASFQLYRETAVGTRDPAADTALGAPCVTSGSPAGCVSATLTFGTYYWVETQAPTGYVLPIGTLAYSAPTTIDAAYAVAGTTATVTVSDAQQPSSLAVRKLDGSTNVPVAGATFELYREATVGTRDPAGDAALGSCTTAGSPAQCVSVTTLLFGTYYWVETVAPAGYVLPASGTARYSAAYTIDATHNGASVATLTVSDAQKLSSLAVQKLDATTGDAVDGATFQLYREVSVGTVNPALDTAVNTPCTTLAANTPTHTCTVSDLGFGTYYWVETTAPAGYVLPTGTASYSAATTINAASAATATTVTLSVADSQLPSGLGVRKLDAATGTAVNGATFQLYREIAVGTQNPALDTAVGTACTTAAANPCVATGLAFGTYYWVETVAPVGYVLPIGPAAYTAAQTVDAAYAAAGTVTTLVVFDAQMLSTLTVRKTNESAEVLAGATFQLWLDGTPDTLVAQCTTDDLGTCSVGSLAFGTYHWVETVAPAFYELPDNPVSAPIVVGPDTAGSTFAPTGFVDPSMPVATVAKTVQSTTQNANGTWTIVYDLAVTNASAKYATTYELVDRLSFGHGITISAATVTGPAGADINPDWNGVDDVGIITHRVIGAGVTEHYTVTVTAEVGAAATATDRDCTVLSDEAGTGFLNAATISLGAQGSTSTACAAPGSPTVTKKVLSLTPGSIEGNWTIAYAVTVSNATPTDVSYSLTDNPGIAPGVETTGASASWLRSALDGSAPSTPTDVSGWTGVAPHDVLATARVLPAGSKDTYTVTLEMVVPADLADDVLACSAAGSGHGYFNAATMTSSGDTFPVSACAPAHASGIDAIVIPPRPVAPDQWGRGGSLAYTGVQVWALIWMGIALLIGGVAVLVLIGRRRPETGDVG